MYVSKYLRYNKLDENSVHGIEIPNVCMYCMYVCMYQHKAPEGGGYLVQVEIDV